MAGQGDARRRWGQGWAKAIIFTMLTECLNACLIFFIPTLVIACIIDHEEAGALIVLAVPFALVRVAIWVKDGIQKNTGGRQ